MQNASSATRKLVVRHKTAMLALIPTIVVVLSALALRMAIERSGHWTFSRVGILAAAGAWFSLYILMYRTVFSCDTIEQRVFPGIVRRLRYVDIQRVKMEWAGQGRMLLLVSPDGRPMKVYGSNDQLTEAQEILFDQVPQAFDGSLRHSDRS
jgi:hypothetical protein